jgi:peptidyl-prolyl cis-trans isomerase C
MGANMNQSRDIPLFLLFTVLSFQPNINAQKKATSSQPSQRDAEKSAHGIAPKAEQNPILAKIGSVNIRFFHFLREVNRLIPLNFYHKKVPPDRMAGFRQQAFDSLVFKTRIYLDALDRGLSVDESEARKRLKDAIKRAGPKYAHLNPQQFEEELKKNRPLIRRVLLIEKNKARFEKTIAKVRDKDLLRIYNSRLKEDQKAFQAPREGRFLHIFIKLDPSRTQKNVEQKKARMAEAKKELDKGTPFAQVARLFSEGEEAKQGGDLGWVKEGTWRSKTLDKVGFEMKSGETSEIIESLYGLHILRCVEMKPDRKMPFKEVKPLLRKWLGAEHKKIALSSWKGELRKKYPVKIFAPDLIIPKQFQSKKKDN